MMCFYYFVCVFLKNRGLLNSLRLYLKTTKLYYDILCTDVIDVLPLTYHINSGAFFLHLLASELIEMSDGRRGTYYCLGLFSTDLGGVP